jgi:hypothetical protein
MALPRLTEEQVKKDPEQQLRNFKRTKDFLVAIDTDGCVNLFSVDRGCNRFIAIQLTLTALQNRKDVQQVLLKRHVKLLNIKPLNEYIAYTKENKLGLGNPSLEEFLNQNPKDFALYKLLGWSEAVNRMFPHISAKIPPFDKVKECLE